MLGVHSSVARPASQEEEQWDMAMPPTQNCMVQGKGAQARQLIAVGIHEGGILFGKNPRKPDETGWNRI